MTKNGDGPNRPNLSLCMIVRDSARTLGACLASIVPWVDEVIVVDTGSNDDTSDIARSFGAQVYHFPWCDDFSAARNHSIDYATGDWVFWMDSDDTIDAECGRKLRELASQPAKDAAMAYVMQVHCPGSDGDDVTVVDHVKLFKNRPELRFEGRIHEQILPAIRRLDGEVAWTDIFVTHSGADHSPEGRRRKQERDLRLLELELADRPDHPFALFNCGMTYADMNRHDEAVEALKRSIDCSSPQESHVRKAYALLVQSLSALGNLDEAKTTCEEGLKLYPRDAELHFRSGIVAGQQNRHADAVSAYREALAPQGERQFSSVDPGIMGHKARHNLAVAYTEMGRPDLAEVQWRQIVRDRPEYAPARRGLSDCLLSQGKLVTVSSEARLLLKDARFVTMGRLLEVDLSLREKDIQGARNQLTTLREESPDDVDVLQAFCRFQFEHGSLEDAAEALEELTRRVPSDGAALHNLGTVRLRQGNLEQAIDCWVQSLRVRPDSVSTLIQLAQTYEAVGRPHEALNVWQSAAHHAPTNEVIRNAIKQYARVATTDERLAQKKISDVSSTPT